MRGSRFLDSPPAALPLELPAPGAGRAVLSDPVPSGLGCATAFWGSGGARREGGPAGFPGATGYGTASAPSPGPRRPRLRGVGNQMATPLASLLQARSSAASESAPEPRAIYAAAGA